MIKNIGIIILATYTLSSGFVYGMNNNNNLKSIKTADDAQQFLNRVVAYQSAKGYFDLEDGYKLSDFMFNYGYIKDCIGIWDSGGPGPDLRQLKPENGVDDHKALTTEMIAKSYLWMRDINAQEAKEIFAAISSDKAKFSYCWEKDNKKILLYLESVQKK